MRNEEITISDISLASGENAILPFGMDMEGILLKYATVQPLTIIREEGVSTYFFF